MADLQPIIIKKVYKSGGGHGGGAWKIAYADFVTAMMAFFLLLWLLNSVTQEQLEGISMYFAPTSLSQSTSGSGGLLGGLTMGEEGAMEQSASTPSAVVDLPPPKSEAEDQQDGEPSDASAAAAALEKLQNEHEDEQFEEARRILNEAINSVPELKEMANSLLVENIPEGLEIQLIDQEGLAMFPSGSAKMYERTRELLELVAAVIVQMPQQISVSGHTDSVKFATDTGYGNWELSADRANNARRVLVELGVPDERIARVVGKAATDPLLPDDPTNARNRRLSIVMLRGTGHPEPEPDKAGEPAPMPAIISEPGTAGGSIFERPGQPGGLPSAPESGTETGDIQRGQLLPSTPKPQPERTERPKPLPSVIQPKTTGGSIFERPGQPGALPAASKDTGDIQRGQLLPSAPKPQPERTERPNPLPSAVVETPESEKPRRSIFENPTAPGNDKPVKSLFDLPDLRSGEAK